VVLTPLYTKVHSVIAAIWAQQASPTPPRLVLNKHCAQCQYASRCHQIATEADDLSLLAKINAKERQGYHEKGIFTVKQLSYTFRPRRRIGRGPPGRLCVLKRPRFLQHFHVPPTTANAVPPYSPIESKVRDPNPKKGGIFTCNR
jgi:hypothetical protein